MPKGVALFDLDGTLVEADHLHLAAWRSVAAPHGVAITEESYRTTIMGFPNTLIMASLLPHLPPAEVTEFIAEKERRFRALATALVPAAGLIAFLDWLEGRGVAIGVVTNAPRANAEQQLAGIGLAGRFGIVVIGEELAEAKPHPLPYLTGLAQLGGAAEASLAFEDSISGLRAARAAGLGVVGLTTSLAADRLLAEGADLAIADFTDPRLIPFALERLNATLSA